MDPLIRNNVNVIGDGDKTFVLAHGFGCDQNMWQFLLPKLKDQGRIVLFDFTGSGKSDVSAYSLKRYRELEGYAQDLLDVMACVAEEPVVLVGHSVGATVGMIAAEQRPDLFSHLALVCPSPCFINHLPEYNGGFERADLEGLLDLMEQNYIGWANHLAPLVMGADADDELVAQLSGSFCSTDPVIARNFAEATFFSDYRSLLPRVQVPSLVMQALADGLAPRSVGQYMVKHMSQAQLDEVDAKGHCLHMTEPDVVAGSIKRFIAATSA